MASFLTILIAAAFVTLPAHGFDMPRIVDVLKQQESGKTDPRTREIMEANFILCVMDVYNGAVAKDLKKLYPDSPCPLCSALCSIKDEMAECARRNFWDPEKERSMVQIIELTFSSVCRPDMMKVAARPETFARLWTTWAICRINITIAECPALKYFRESSDLEIERITCWYSVKPAECVKKIVGVEMPQYYDAVSSIVNDIKCSKDCGKYYQEIFDSEGHCKYDSFSRAMIVSSRCA